MESGLTKVRLLVCDMFGTAPGLDHERGRLLRSMDRPSNCCTDSHRDRHGRVCQIPPPGLGWHVAGDAVPVLPASAGGGGECGGIRPVPPIKLSEVLAFPGIYPCNTDESAAFAAGLVPGKPPDSRVSSPDDLFAGQLAPVGRFLVVGSKANLVRGLA